MLDLNLRKASYSIKNLSVRSIHKVSPHTHTCTYIGYFNTKYSWTD